MQTQKDILLIGRFQPLCLHHAEIFRYAKLMGERLLIGVGQPDLERASIVLTPNQRSHYQLSYRFPFQQVKDWIERTGICVDAIVPVQDIFDEKRFAAHVIETFESQGIQVKNPRLLTDNEWTARCFRSAGIEVGLTPPQPYHATDVRKELAKNGRDGRLAADLTPRDIMKIRKAERAKEYIGNDGLLLQDGFNKLVGIPNNGTLFEILLTDDAVAIMYIDDLDQVYFTRQYRAGIRKTVLELPAGMVDKAGVSAIQIAVEELQEECGIRISPDQARHLATLESSAGLISEMVGLYTARGAHIVTGQHLDESERIEVVRIPFDEAYAMIRTGGMIGPKTIILLQNEHIKRQDERIRQLESRLEVG